MLGFSAAVFFVSLMMRATASALRRAHSSVSAVSLFGRPVFIKRDDLLVSCSCQLNGNKGRKFKHLLSSDKAPPAILSYGGTQSNSMLALSKIAESRGLDFRYICRKVPAHLASNPMGNYRAALQAGMQIHEVDNGAYSAVVQWSEAGADLKLFDPAVLPLLPWAADLPQDWQFIPQGGAMATAEEGVGELAEELWEYIRQSDRGGPWKVGVCRCSV
mmetsp:Transcript_31628/g.68080  ORF Transcript_31628/g.68080 Transcript_31628/m.68080 type:complete len:217 (+) Transcript_31628:88-738(+)